MPAHSLNLPAASRRPLAARLAAGLCAALLGPIAAAADVLVVTDSRHPVQAYLDFVLDAGAAQLIRQNRAVIHRPDARLHLPRVACRTLVLCGEADQLTPPDCAREIAALVPGAELHVLPGCGHMLTMEQPEAVGHRLAQWLGHWTKI